MTAIVIDTETHAVENPIVIEYGAAIFEIDQHGNVSLEDTAVSRHSCPVPIDFGAMATHGITDEEVADCLPFSLENVDFNADYIIGHNIDFDWTAIQKPNVKRICTLALSRHVWPDAKSHRLMALVFMLDKVAGKKFFASAHSVATDIEACFFVLWKITEAFGITSIEELWQESEKARIPTKISFGKHSGSLIKDIPNDYCRWYAGQTDCDQYLITAMKQVGKL